MFTPEKLSDEHRLMAQTTDEFVESEVLPSLDRLEAKDWELARSLIRRSGELGLLGIAVPEEYGGLDLDKASSLVGRRTHRAVGVVLRRRSAGRPTCASCRSCCSARPAQKRSYLPRLVDR